MKQKTQNKKTALVWHTLPNVIHKASSSKDFLHAYNEELARLTLAKKIRAIRTAHKLTQKTVADRAGMSQSVIARLESGTHSISLDTLNKIVTALGKRMEVV